MTIGSSYNISQYSEKQKAIYQYIATWCNSIGMATGTNSGGYTSQWMLGEAEKYYNSWKNQPDNAYLTDNIGNIDNIKKENITYQGEDYIKIGPFNWSFASTYSAKYLYDQDGRDITSYAKFGKYVGTTFNVYDTINDASSSGNDFYLLVKTSSNANSVKLKATVSNSKENLSATIYILESGNGRQNLLVGRGNRTYHTTTAEIEVGPIELLGDLEISKTDSTTTKPLANVGFTLKMTSGSQSGKYVGIDSQNNVIYKTEKVNLRTNHAGKIQINRLIPGDYELVETINPYEGYEDLPRTIGTIHVKAGKDNVKNVTNTRSYITLSGYAWEDKAWQVGKEEYSNELYKEKKDTLDTNDELVENVIVQLKNTKGNVIKETTTDQNGNYRFEKVEIDQLPEYYIEFIYNGMSYETVSIKDLSYDNGTKAIEGSNRSDYNNEYAMISKGQSNTSDGKKTHDLIYDTQEKNGNTTSTIHYGENLKYGYADATDPINGTEEQYLIAANTKNAYQGYLDKIKTPNEIRQQEITEIKNINLGIKKREQPDLSVIKDLQSAKVSINGVEHVYQYADRFNQDLYADYDSEGKSGYEMDTAVKFGQKYGKMSYTRALYASDIKYTGSKKLEVKVTYKIGIRNNSSNINAVVNQLTDYFDSKYELEGIGTEINSDGSIQEGTQLEHTNPEAVGSDYQKIVIQSNLTIPHQKEGYVYVELRVKPENIGNIVDKGEDVKLDNITEITAYSMKDENGNPYAGIDKDSQPGNLDINDSKTYEDDTDKAPGLLITLQEERKTQGTVFEDVTEEELKTGEIRQANGLLDENDKGISGVTVTLVDTDGNIVQAYDEEKDEWENAEDTTDENGKYTIGGFLPGEYQIKYTWGDKNYKVQDYKSTIVDKDNYEEKTSNEEWYKINPEKRESDALDDYDKREEIDKESPEITNAEKVKIEESYQDDTLEEKVTTQMEATTPKFVVNVEYDTAPTNSREEYEQNEDGTIKKEDNHVQKEEKHQNILKNIDFGIVKRAQQVLKLDKNIRNVKVTLDDGSILVSATLDENGKLVEETKHITYIEKSAVNGQVKIEIDSEIIQSAKLEVEYGFQATNISEIEYLTKDFYYYGEGYGEVTDKMVTLNTMGIIDYLDGNLITDMEINSDWQVISGINPKNQLITDGLLENTQNMKNHLTNTERILQTDKLAGTMLKPIEEQNIANINLKAYRLLANNEESYFENEAEIIKVGRNGGSIITTIPGNYIPANSDTSEEDNATSESVVILPPPGLTTDKIAWILLTVSCLGILTSGIILIKKYVLKK